MTTEPLRGGAWRKLSEGRLSKLLREAEKRQPQSIECCDLKAEAERQELERLLKREKGKP